MAVASGQETCFLRREARYSPEWIGKALNTESSVASDEIR